MSMTNHATPTLKNSNAKTAVSTGSIRLKKDGSLVDSIVRDRFFDTLALRRTAQPVNACELMLLLRRLTATAKPGVDTLADDDGRVWLTHSQKFLMKLLRQERGQIERGMAMLRDNGVIEHKRLRYGRAKMRRTGVRFTPFGDALFHPLGTAGVIDAMAKLKPATETHGPIAGTVVNKESDSKFQAGPTGNGALKHEGSLALKTPSQLAPNLAQLKGTSDPKIEVTKRIVNSELVSLLVSQEVTLNSVSSPKEASPLGSHASKNPLGGNEPKKIAGKITNNDCHPLPLDKSTQDKLEISSPLENKAATTFLQPTALLSPEQNQSLGVLKHVTDATTTAELEKLWRRAVEKHFGEKPRPFSGKERGQLRYFILALARLYLEADELLAQQAATEGQAPTGSYATAISSHKQQSSLDHKFPIAAFVLERVVHRWEQFVTLVRNEWFHGNRKLESWPPRPHMGFLLVNVETAIFRFCPCVSLVQASAAELSQYDATLDAYITEILARGFELPIKKKKHLKAVDQDACKPSGKHPDKEGSDKSSSTVGQAATSSLDSTPAHHPPKKMTVKLSGLASTLNSRRMGYRAELQEIQTSGDFDEEYYENLRTVHNNLVSAILLLQEHAFLSEAALRKKFGPLSLDEVNGSLNKPTPSAAQR